MQCHSQYTRLDVQIAACCHAILLSRALHHICNCSHAITFALYAFMNWQQISTSVRPVTQKNQIISHALTFRLSSNTLYADTTFLQSPLAAI